MHYPLIGEDVLSSIVIRAVWVVVVKKWRGGSWYFAHISRISNEGGGEQGKKTHQIIGGLPKIAREKI